MPADLSTNSRRISRKSPNDDLDIRRARGEISCAECRRLKLKCDRKVPCSSCTRRGYPSLCPNGSLSSGQGTRFVLANTAQLHSKISEMGTRIRQLEDVLAIFQSNVSSETHSLLRDDLLAVKFAPDRNIAPDIEDPLSGNAIDLIDARGILTVGDQGGKYYGAGTEALFLAGAEIDTADDESPPPVSVETSNLDPDPSSSDHESTAMTLEEILDHLPSQPRAWALYEAYAEHAAWTFCPVRRDEMIDGILSPVYKALSVKQGSGTSTIAPVSPHKLAVLFIIFSLGTLVDLTLKPYHSESDTYYRLSRACLSLRSVFDSPEMATVQAVALTASYQVWAGKRHTMDSAWALMSLGAKLAQTIGLHRDGARFQIDAKTVQHRRALFWELFSVETFYSLTLGRPPSLRLSYVDCEFPEDDQATLDEDGNVLVGFHRWKYEFIKEILCTIAELTLSATAPEYQTVLELDCKVREKVLPPHLTGSGEPETKLYSPLAYMHQGLLGQYRSVALMYIHRSFFAQAILDHPIDPLRSAYAPSFLAAYRSASIVIKSSLEQYERFPELVCRAWGVWTNLFPAAIIVGCIVARSPSSGLAPSAFNDLGLVCDLFKKGAILSRRARDGLPILCKLKEKAYHAYSQFRRGGPTTPNTNLAGNDGHDDELALYGGQTKVLVSKLLSNRSSQQNKSPFGLPVPSVSDSDSGLTSAQSAYVHPALVEYLSMVPLAYTGNTSNTSQFPIFGHEDIATSSSQHQPEYTTAWQSQNTQFRWQPASSGPTNPPASHQDYSSPHNYSFAAPFESAMTQWGSDDAIGDLVMDEQWQVFARNTGLLDGILNDSGLFYGVGGTMPSA